MNTITEEENKNRVLKALAIGGFVALLIVIAWLGIQLVGLIPNAFNSLASLADTVYNHEEVTIDVISSEDVANAGESFGLTWETPKQSGDYTFTYTCTEGVSIDVRTIGGDIEPVTCGVEKSLGDVGGIDVIVNSEKTRFTDIPYVIAFIPNGEDVAVASTANTITVVNPSISPDVAVATTTPPVVTPTTPKPTTPAATTTPVKPVTPKPTTVTHTTYTYAIPVSNPNGFTDLAVTLVRVGTVSGGVFVTNGVIDNDTSGTILFEIKNIGTKTSNSFTYTATLPNGTLYTSPVQTALKPNERATIAIAFVATDMIGTKSFSVSVANAGETVTSNNVLIGLVSITD